MRYSQVIVEHFTSICINETADAKEEFEKVSKMLEEAGKGNNERKNDAELSGEIVKGVESPEV